MNKVPNTIKYLICGISAILFLLFFFEIINPFELNGSLQKITGYFFAFPFNNLDYLAISSVPIFGMLLNSMRKEFKMAELIKDISIVVVFVLIAIAVGLYILTVVGKPTNPLIPQYLISEPFFFYSTITITIGIAMPFLFKKRTKKPSEIDEIGKHS